MNEPHDSTDGCTRKDCVLENRHAGPCRSFAIPPGDAIAYGRENLRRHREMLALLSYDATPAELAGRYHGAHRMKASGGYPVEERRETMSGLDPERSQFSFEEQHCMQACRCRVINHTIVKWCPAHAHYYEWLSSYEREMRPALWAKLTDEQRAVCALQMIESDRRQAQIAKMAARWDGVDEREDTRR